MDGANRKATFKDLKTEEDFEVDFDILHIVPPNKAHEFLAPIAAPTGLVDIDFHTLQHNKLSNVFAIGDCANLPTAKTAAAVFSQGPVLVNNLIKFINGEPLNASYDGYSSCPVFTGDKKLMLVEFKYDGVSAETFYKGQTTANRAFYHFKRDAFPFVYWQIMPRGQWYGKNMIFKPKFA